MLGREDTVCFRWAESKDSWTGSKWNSSLIVTHFSLSLSLSLSLSMVPGDVSAERGSFSIIIVLKVIHISLVSWEKS